MSPLHGHTVEGALDAASWSQLVAELFLQAGRGEDPRSELEERVQQRHVTIHEGRRYDYGVVRSVREIAARQTIDDYFEIVDVRDCLLRMQRGVVDCIK